MEIRIRPYRPDDARQLIAVFRDASNTLRKSRGGTHPDCEIDSLINRPDKELLSMLLHGSIVFVADVDGTGQLAGMGALTNHIPSRIMNSTYSRNHYVCEAFQRGKAGVSVGRLLREATLSEAKRRGFRKVYGYSTPEAVGFHKKFGAVFYPSYDTHLYGTVLVRYYEIELRKSMLNRLRLEPYAHLAGRLYGQMLSFFRHPANSG